ncbi:3D domain-containing protein [Ruminiclostridium cellulolyticum]|uniref:3D domain protein n=1 Tax=Ruminiclostridium cellulolyticum (strain ATCC 35319 / DSM 5812 / JCM 6584 / H10) TaxID=394503 RepID=B8I4K4_RUMCH|nr:3D domain-containing protein [Ruminiclostridium cellulolyticum]ACL74558.1 3D domain protein [Ruminiclostridium cellulolyticum H10]
MTPIAKNIKRYFSELKIRSLDVAIVCIVVVISVTAGFLVFNGLNRHVVINDNGHTIAVKTMRTTVKEVLEQTGIKVDKADYISMPFDAKLTKIHQNVINIKRAVPVSIKVDGKELDVKTCKDTVSEVLKDNNISVDSDDKFVGSQLGDKIVSNMKISIVRVEEKTITETLPIPFKTITKENKRLDKGVRNTVRQGKEGVREKLYKVVFEDGKQTTKQLIKDFVATNPLNCIVEVGTVLNYNTARGETIRFSKVLDMRATSYTASFKDTGKRPGEPGFGITATGAKVRRGIIAVDPRVIPLGTRVYVEVPGKAADYGYAVASDTGGAIKGNKIDVYLESGSQVDAWGVKKVKVYILK